MQNERVMRGVRVTPEYVFRCDGSCIVTLMNAHNKMIFEVLTAITIKFNFCLLLFDAVQFGTR